MKSIRLLIAFSLFSMLFIGCDQRKDINPVESKKNAENEIRQDTYTKLSEKEDLDEKVKNNKGIFVAEQYKPYDISASVTFNHEQDADRIVYEILMENFTSELKNVIQSFTLEPTMIQYYLTGDLTSTNALNNSETNLYPNKEPFGLSLYRGYVINNETINMLTDDSYLNMYIKISYGDKNNRTEDFWYIKATPTKEVLDYLKSIAH
ncbi:hypothetical protein [Paenibacillus senegalimassiliensis]|uniref:hypothetical protein n=1 Tax=Paenibacillus senegalimassiliensis TaxID=1737426 RepID=UPI00073EDFD2|nr:hypothetical protein [Paenibacillus senegalimassiliensis]